MLPQGGLQLFLTPGIAQLSLAAIPFPVLFTAAAKASGGSSDALGSAITAAAALGAALIAGGLTWIVGKETRNVAAQVAAGAQLREARQRAADDVRAVSNVGSGLEKAVAKLLETDGAASSRRAVEAGCVDLEARLEFIWDDDLRTRMDAFAHHSRECSAAFAAEEVRAHGATAVEAWTSALERAGAVWRTLERAAIDAPDLLIAGSLNLNDEKAGDVNFVPSPGTPSIDIPKMQ